MSPQQGALHLRLLPLLLPGGPETQAAVLSWGVWAELEPPPWGQKAQALVTQGWGAVGRGFQWGGLNALQMEVPWAVWGAELTERLHCCWVLRVSGDRVNVGCGPAEQRLLLTGLHSVADIFCESCKTTLGWKYVSTWRGGHPLKWTVAMALLAPGTTAGFCTVRRGKRKLVAGSD